MKLVKPFSDTGCECSSNSSCHISLSPDCNCNSFLPNSSDRGVIYSLAKLPIMKLNYGGSISPYSFINFKLGPMVCSGKSTFYPSEMAEAERNQLKEWSSNWSKTIPSTSWLVLMISLKASNRFAQKSWGWNYCVPCCRSSSHRRRSRR